MNKTANITEQMEISSDAFSNNETIPDKFTCQGKNIFPPLEIEDIPDEAKSLALIVDDPDAPGGTFVHWIAYNIPVESEDMEIEETLPKEALQGINDFKKIGYGGPCPPSGIHRYFFKAYALDSKLDLKEGASKADLEKAMKDHILSKAELVGKYSKN